MKVRPDHSQLFRPGIARINIPEPFPTMEYRADSSAVAAGTYSTPTIRCVQQSRRSEVEELAHVACRDAIVCVPVISRRYIKRLFYEGQDCRRVSRRMRNVVWLRPWRDHDQRQSQSEVLKVACVSLGPNVQSPVSGR